MDNNEKLIEEAAIKIDNDAWLRADDFRAVFDRPFGPTEQQERKDTARVKARAVLAVFEKAQGEPSDAQVEGGCVAFYEGAQGITSWARLAETDPQLANRYRDGIRAALRAAGGAQ